jgi:hypothetical protein
MRDYPHGSGVRRVENVGQPEIDGEREGESKGEKEREKERRKGRRREGREETRVGRRDGERKERGRGEGKKKKYIYRSAYMIFHDQKLDSPKMSIYRLES